MSSIDINSGKLVEWIVSRLKINKEWSEKVLKIRQKISNALEDMPESPEIKQIILGTYINYFHCVKILDILKEVECSTRNIFGQYSSQRIKDWRDIVKSYEQGNNYLVECAQILNQNICFEIPATKKAIEKNNKTISDSSRKEKECVTTVHEASATLKRMCVTYNIELDPRRDGGSEDIRVQLKQSTMVLPSMVRSLEEKLEPLRVSFELYRQYVHATLGKVELVCPLLEYVLEKGNTTVYEWKHGLPPVLMARSEAAADVLSGQAEDEISWDVDPEEAEEDFSVVDFGIEVEGEHNGVRDNEMRTLLEDLDTRELILDDLWELSEFFAICIEETKTRVGSMLDSIENVDDSRLVLLTKVVESARSAVAAFISQVTDKSLVHLLMLESGVGYEETIVSRLERERSIVLKYSNMEALLKERAVEMSRDTVVQEERLVLLRAQCKELKSSIEAAISSSLGDRVVRIVGEIATI